MFVVELIALKPVARRTALLRPLASALLGEALANGIKPDFVRILISNEALPPTKDHATLWPWPLKIVTLGGFKFFQSGEPLQLSRKTPRRLFNLLKALNAFGGRDVAQERIIDAVWPDEDGDSARQSFDVAVHRLRKFLGVSQAIVVKDGRIGLEPSRCWLDTWAFEQASACRILRWKRLNADFNFAAAIFLPATRICPGPRHYAKDCAQNM